MSLLARASNRHERRSLFGDVELLRNTSPDPATQRPHRKALMREVLRMPASQQREPINAVAEALDNPYSLRRPPRLSTSYEASLHDVDQLRYELSAFERAEYRRPSTLDIHFGQAVLDELDPIVKGYELLDSYNYATAAERTAASRQRKSGQSRGKKSAPHSDSCPATPSSLSTPLLTSRRQSILKQILHPLSRNSISGGQLTEEQSTIEEGCNDLDNSEATTQEKRILVSSAGVKSSSAKRPNLPALKVQEPRIETANTRTVRPNINVTTRSSSRRVSQSTSPRRISQPSCPTSPNRNVFDANSATVPMSIFSLAPSIDLLDINNPPVGSTMHAVLSPSTQMLLRKFVCPPPSHNEKQPAPVALSFTEPGKSSKSGSTGEIIEPLRKDKAKIDRIVVRALAGITGDDISTLSEVVAPRLSDRASRARVLGHPADVRVKWAHGKSLIDRLVTSGDRDITDTIQHFIHEFSQQRTSRVLGNYVEGKSYTVERDMSSRYVENPTQVTDNYRGRQTARTTLDERHASNKTDFNFDPEQQEALRNRKLYISQNRREHGQVFEAFLASTYRHRRMHDDDPEIAQASRKILDLYPPAKNNLLPRTRADPMYASLVETSGVILRSRYVTLAANAAKTLWVLLTIGLGIQSEPTSVAQITSSVSELKAEVQKLLPSTLRDMVHASTAPDQWFALRALCRMNSLTTQEWPIIQSRLGELGESQRYELVDLVSSLDLKFYLSDMLRLAEVQISHSNWRARNDSVRILSRTLERAREAFPESWRTACGVLVLIEPDNGEKYFAGKLVELQDEDQSDEEEDTVTTNDNTTSLLDATGLPPSEPALANAVLKRAGIILPTDGTSSTSGQLWSIPEPLVKKLTRSFQQLTTLMTDDWNETVRRESAEAIAKLGLIHMLLTHNRRLLVSGDPTRRVDALRILGAVKLIEKQIWRRYLAAFHDDFIAVRIEACKVAYLLGFCHSKLVRALIDRLDDGDYHVRAYAVKALTSVSVDFHDQSFVPTVLIRFLSHEMSPPVKAQVLQTLSALTYSPRFPSMHGPMAEEVKAILVEHYRGDPSPLVREHAEMALAIAGVNLASVVKEDNVETDEHIVVREVRDMTERGKVLREVMALIADG